jgi:tetratricopeptide (TPR) repeat protein
MQIRRDRSSLRFGSRSRNQGTLWIFMAWVLSMAIIFGVVWRFNAVQAQVEGLVSGPSSPTPSGVSLAQQAEDAYWKGDLDTSIELYRKAAALEPDNVGIQFEYIRNLIYGSYVGRGYFFRAEIAVNVAADLVKRHENDPMARAGYALALIENGRADEGAAEALRAVELNPGWAEAHAYLSLAYRAQNRWRLAQEQAQDAVDLNPMSVDARRAFALSLAFTGQWAVAISQYEQAIQIHPRLDALYFELAPYYIVQENYDAAIQAYDRVLANNPRNVKAWTRKCETYFRQRDDANAQEACEQAIELDPTFPEAHRQLGQVRYTRRNYEGAVESFETCIALMDAQGWPMSERLEQCYYLHGLAWFLLGNCTNAASLFEQAFLVDLTERGRQITLEGIDLCVAYDQNLEISDFPTPPPPTQEPPPPIGIY